MNGLLGTLKLWVDSDTPAPTNQQTFNFARCIPFIALHLACLGVIWVGVSTTAVVFCVAFFFIRMFAITAFYHRYFSHRSFKTSRPAQFVFAVLGNMAAQRGPLWWAGHHRHHHQHSDQDLDLHSPVKRGFWWSHVGWFTCDASFNTPKDRIKDFYKYPELVFLNRYDTIIPIVTALSIFALGELLAVFAPKLETNGYQLVVWGFVVSTVALFHSTVTINSLAHVWGKKRFNTNDNSRNNAFLALLTLGEGWHNNHHRYPRSAKHGFAKHELDITYLLLLAMSKIGLIWALQPIPQHVKNEMKP